MIGLKLQLAPRPTAEGRPCPLRGPAPPPNSILERRKVHVQRSSDLLSRCCCRRLRRRECALRVRPGGQEEGHQYPGKLHLRDDLTRDQASPAAARAGSVPPRRTSHSQGRLSLAKCTAQARARCSKGPRCWGAGVSGGQTPKSLPWRSGPGATDPVPRGFLLVSKGP